LVGNGSGPFVINFFGHGFFVGTGSGPFVINFFGHGFFVGTGSGPFAVKTALDPADKTDFNPIAPTRIAMARAIAPSLLDIVPPWNSERTETLYPLQG
jgi:hypothetical protein